MSAETPETEQPQSFGDFIGVLISALREFQQETEVPEARRNYALAITHLEDADARCARGTWHAENEDNA